MRLYFSRFGWSNATLADFLACLEESSGRDLDEWSRLWLRTASVNTLAAEWQVDGDRISALSIQQTAPPEHPTLRPHALEVALANDGEKLKIDSIDAWIDGPDTPLPEARGHVVPDLVFPNYGDHAYAKVALDPASVDFVRTKLDRVDDHLLRELLWMSLWEMVRDRQLRSSEYLAIGRGRLPLEPDLDILDVVLDRSALTIARYIPEGARESEAHTWFEAALRNMADSDGDRRILWARSAINVATTAEDVSRLVELVEGAGKVDTFSGDQEMRWAIAVKAVAFDLLGADERLALEANRDRSDRGRRALLKAAASVPSALAKEEAWQKIHTDGYGSFHLTRAAMQGFFWPQQGLFVEPYVERFFGSVGDIFATRDHPFSRSYLLALYPAYRADPAVLERSRRMLSELNGKLPTLTRQLAEITDDLDRQIKVRAFAETAD